MNFIHPISDDHLDYLKSTWDSRDQAWINEHIDPRFIDFIKRLNTHPEMTTMYHCSGHILGEKDYDPTYVRSYLVVCAKGDALAGLNKLHDDILTVYGTPTVDQRREHLGWIVEPAITIIAPWYHCHQDPKDHKFQMERTNSCAIYLSVKIKDDPLGVQTVSGGIGLIQPWRPLRQREHPAYPACLPAQRQP